MMAAHTLGSCAIACIQAVSSSTGPAPFLAVADWPCNGCWSAVLNWILHCMPSQMQISVSTFKWHSDGLQQCCVLSVVHSVHCEHQALNLAHPASSCCRLVPARAVKATARYVWLCVFRRLGHHLFVANPVTFGWSRCWVLPALIYKVH